MDVEIYRIGDVQGTRRVAYRFATDRTPRLDHRPLVDATIYMGGIIIMIREDIYAHDDDRAVPATEHVGALCLHLCKARNQRT